MALQPVAPEALLDHVKPGADLIVPLACGEPTLLIDALEAVAAESLSIETELDRRLILRGFGVDLGVEPDRCAVPDGPAAPSIATGGPSRVRGELPEALRRGAIR